MPDRSPESIDNSSEEVSTTAGPDETQYDLMEIVAKAAGPQAEDRRQEMSTWSDATGGYADAAAGRAVEASRAATAGGATLDESRAAMSRASRASATYGEPVPAGQAERVVKPIETGMTSLNIQENTGGPLGSIETLRSPAQIARDAEYDKQKSTSGDPDQAAD